MYYLKFSLKTIPTTQSFVLILILALSSLAQAQKITVKKVKGTTAIVETTTELTEGETYELATLPVSQEVDYKQSVLRSRQNSFTLGTSYEYIRSDILSSAQLSLQARYGWNFSSLEFGLVAEAQSSDQGAGATTTVLAGGYFDYNLISNRDPKNLIYGPFVLLATGSTQYPSTQTGGSSTKIISNMGGFVTYFLAESSAALRAEGFYNYQQINTTAQQNSVGGFGFRGLLVFYF